ncbi:MAG TPA: hypothetical protein VL202_03930 [Pararhizobium sp.]|uniref:FitA-like ribbon-helix-helix domain-containing protein n=1 Tax=Pararhizobium sp. TaxID=1977563 RepID=UPI002BDAC90A|nr:hypothetical protein [Pararhizobium sp.]HTO30318.1 hypothetical protein [Pararhizobium sp.]
MPAVTIRNLPEATHRALKARAALHGRSTEAKIRDIIEGAVRPQARVRLGSELAANGFAPAQKQLGWQSLRPMVTLRQRRRPTASW